MLLVELRGPGVEAILLKLKWLLLLFRGPLFVLLLFDPAVLNANDDLGFVFMLLLVLGLGYVDCYWYGVFELESKNRRLGVLEVNEN